MTGILLKTSCCCESEPGCPSGCPDCSTLVLVTIDNLHIQRDDFTAWRFNHVEMVLTNLGQDLCDWRLESLDDVLVNDVDIVEPQVGDFCTFISSGNPQYPILAPNTLFCFDNEWRFNLNPQPGGVLPVCLSATDDCPIGLFEPCIPPYDKCGLYEGAVVISEL